MTERGVPGNLPRLRVSSVWSSFRIPLAFFERGEGLAPFPCGGRWAPFRPTPAAAEPRCAKKGIPASTEQRPREPEEDRPIDPMSGKNASAKRARSGFEPLALADGRQPSMPQRVSHNPCLRALSLRFRLCEADAAAFRRARVKRLSSSDGSLLATFKVPVKKLLRKFVGKLAPALMALASWLTSAVAGPFRGSAHETSLGGRKLPKIKPQGSHRAKCRSYCSARFRRYRARHVQGVEGPAYFEEQLTQAQAIRDRLKGK
jgi:hypothetical protein